jgi:hypothetical protein
MLKDELKKENSKEKDFPKRFFTALDCILILY